MDMTEEQEALFFKLTPLQQKFSMNYLRGMSKDEAYVESGGKAKSDESIRRAISSIVTNCHVLSFINSIHKDTLDKALDMLGINTYNVAKALAREAKLHNETAPDDDNQSGRVSALKVLSNCTGGFDKNTSKHEIGGYIEQPLSDLYNYDDKE